MIDLGGERIDGIARTERRWLITKTNPKPRELKPKFKERF